MSLRKGSTIARVPSENSASGEVAVKDVIVEEMDESLKFPQEEQKQGDLQVPT